MNGKEGQVLRGMALLGRRIIESTHLHSGTLGRPQAAEQRLPVKKEKMKTIKFPAKREHPDPFSGFLLKGGIPLAISARVRSFFEKSPTAKRPRVPRGGSLNAQTIRKTVHEGVDRPTHESFKGGLFKKGIIAHPVESSILFIRGLLMRLALF